MINFAKGLLLPKLILLVLAGNYFDSMEKDEIALTKTRPYLELEY